MWQNSFKNEFYKLSSISAPDDLPGDEWKKYIRRIVPLGGIENKIRGHRRSFTSSTIKDGGKFEKLNLIDRARVNVRNVGSLKKYVPFLVPVAGIGAGVAALSLYDKYLNK